MLRPVVPIDFLARQLAGAGRAWSALRRRSWMAKYRHLAIAPSRDCDHGFSMPAPPRLWRPPAKPGDTRREAGLGQQRAQKRLRAQPQAGCRRAGGISCRPRRYFRSASLRMRYERCTASNAPLCHAPWQRTGRCADRPAAPRANRHACCLPTAWHGRRGSCVRSLAAATAG